MPQTRFINVSSPFMNVGSFSSLTGQSNIQVQRSHTFPLKSVPVDGGINEPADYSKLLVEPKPPGPPPFPQDDSQTPNRSSVPSLLTVARCASAPIHNRQNHKELQDFADTMSKTLLLKRDRLELAPPTPTNERKRSFPQAFEPYDLPPLEPMFKPQSSEAESPQHSPFTERRNV
eukprot:CAMPEP_0206182452 /NCGR_PEP_ID=MMETSP0166-20121206/69_1 /ASSEMBLY_ACC=CAM_ASM_000260 /TAXON_ID=95228 /ORGANISM="Vannella robusta, Strain DIVA3 518/3/11/1/6" /LENGTH=174 /DNA_ID=CAMNT_0053597155 /DNA_START=525 /DNA_END=1049 /DNA_ORIENTATION=+